MSNNIDQKAVETVRFLSVDAIEKAKSGHPGLPMGAASMAFTLWSRFLKGSGADPNWPDRDRFVLSAGHGSMLLYSLLHLFGYDVSVEDLKNFRQWGSKTPGHPEYGHTPGVETTTGPLGQGIGNAVGMAMAERRLAAQFNTEDFKIVDHYTYAIAGDGDMMEGVSSEAVSLAGHHKLGKLIVFYDDNNITIDGTTDITFTEDVGRRFDAYGWEIIRVKDSNDIHELEDAITRARENENQPSLIIVPTVIGYGSPNKQGKSAAHGAPLGQEEIQLVREQHAWKDTPDFHIPEDVATYMESIIERREQQREDWEEKFHTYRQMYPEKASEWDKWFNNELDMKGIEQTIWNFEDKAVATRASGGQILNGIASHVPNLVGGSADLNASTKTYMKDKGDFQPDSPKANNINFGVREHGMGSVLNGMQAHGGLRVFGSTFMVFSNYMTPAIRLSALMDLPVVYVFTHDSIAVGEDGPTHQPIEHLVSLRSIPNVTVFRPADAKETAIAWMEAMKHKSGPSVLALTRQGLPLLQHVDKEAAAKGGYILEREDGDRPDIILIGSGSEVSLLVEARKALKKEGVDARVVSMLSLEVYERQQEDYKEQVLPRAVTKRLAIEAGSTMGWYKYVGTEGKVIGIDEFGASAPGDIVMEKFGFSVSNVVEKVKMMMEH